MLRAALRRVQVWSHSILSPGGFEPGSWKLVCWVAPVPMYHYGSLILDPGRGNILHQLPRSNCLLQPLLSTARHSTKASSAQNQNAILSFLRQCNFCSEFRLTSNNLESSWSKRTSMHKYLKLMPEVSPLVRSHVHHITLCVKLIAMDKINLA